MGSQDKLLEDHEPKLMKVAMPVKQEVKKERKPQEKQTSPERVALFSKQFGPQTSYILLKCSPCQSLPVQLRLLEGSLTYSVVH